ncbi:low molecular weight phosphatase family protein [Pseudoxanthomonas jiangsuensis]|uniref:arsenate reductase ArsC n=1 Tax=Pseudoxanthomonas jiangsuensis TaxID=619688 RepID=UPI001390934A|nr:arsenate reductase ArsC [Pseudoxanthomonas jiangsuensis]KAF1697933.1 low molecular weight phosphatase family protein [Pseudoxanthomonas jiangsuensis]
MSQRPYRVLFLCTGNSARSVLAEATLRAWAGHRFEAFSAGSQPAGRVNPFALERLAAEGIPTTGLRSKSWDEFATADAAPMDLVVTVCDAAASESCPVVFGDFLRVHWGLPDPAAVEGSDEDRREAFRQAHRVVKARLLALLALPADAWADRAALKGALDRIGLVEPEDAGGNGATEHD